MYLCFHKKMKLYRVGPEHFQKLIHSSQSLVAAIFVTSFQFTINRCAECWVCNRCNPWPSKHSGRNNFLWWSHERKHGQLLDVTNKYKYIHLPVDDWKYSHGQCFKLTVGHRGGDIQVLGCFSYSGLGLLHWFIVFKVESRNFGDPSAHSTGTAPEVGCQTHKVGHTSTTKNPRYKVYNQCCPTSIFRHVAFELEIKWKAPWLHHDKGSDAPFFRDTLCPPVCILVRKKGFAATTG